MHTDFEIKLFTLLRRGYVYTLRMYLFLQIVKYNAEIFTLNSEYYE